MTVITKMTYDNSNSVGLDPIPDVPAVEQAIYEHANVKHWWRADHGFDPAAKKWYCRKTLDALVPGSTGFPTLVASVAAYNDEAVLHFAASTSNLQLATGLPTGGAYGVIVVGRAADGSGFSLWGSDLSAGATSGTYVTHNETGASLSYQSVYPANPRRTAVTPGWPYESGPNLVVASHDPSGAGDIGLRINQGQFSSSTTGATTANSSSLLRIGRAGNDGNIYGAGDGEIAEVIVTNTYVIGNLTLLSLIEDYMADRYGL